MRLAIPEHKTHCWAVTGKSCNYKGHCAYANGYPVLAGSFDVLTVKTSAKNGKVFWEE
jgi:hypothetical protein